MSARTSTRKRRRGQALVEFTLVAPLLFLMLFGVIEGGRLVWTNHEVVNGTREGARLAMVANANTGSPVTETDVRNRVLDTTSGLQPGLLTVTAPGLGGDVGEKVAVVAAYEYQPIIGMIFGIDPITLNARSEVTIQR